MKAILIMFLSVFLVDSLCAHTPTGITIQPDFENEKITIVIQHHTTTRKDYIRVVKLALDGNTPKDYIFYLQANWLELSFAAFVPGLQKAKRVEVKAYPTRGFPLTQEFSLDEFRDSSVSKIARPAPSP